MMRGQKLSAAPYRVLDIPVKTKMNVIIVLLRTPVRVNDLNSLIRPRCEVGR